MKCQLLLLISIHIILSGSASPNGRRSQTSSLPLKEATAEDVQEEVNEDGNEDDPQGRSILNLQSRLAEFSDFYSDWDTIADAVEDAEYGDDELLMDEEWNYRRKRAAAGAAVESSVVVVPTSNLPTSVTTEATASAGNVEVKNRISLAVGGAAATSLGRQTVKTSVSSSTVVKTGIYNTLTATYYPIYNSAGAYNFNGGGAGFGSFGSFGGPQAWTGSFNRAGPAATGGTSFAGFSRDHPGTAHAYNHQHTDVVPLQDGLVLLKNLPG